jgi:signal transduction histidine kinase
MAAWTGLAPWLYRFTSVPAPVLGADLAISVSLILATSWVQERESITSGAATLPSFWVSACVLGWAVVRGPLAGVAAAAAISVADLVVIGSDLNRTTVENIAQLLMIGLVVGWISRLGVAAERSQSEAAALRAATVEREKLAAEIHDGVLQILSLVRRRTSGLPAELGELADLAGDQEAALRALAVGRMSPPASGLSDLRELLQQQARANVTVSAPAEPVLLEASAAREVAAAVAAALDNVEQHVGAGAPAWVLIEDDRTEVVVTVRDNGQGVTSQRLALAREAGRLGVAASIEARMRSIGGMAVVVTGGEQGTEVELRAPH